MNRSNIRTGAFVDYSSFHYVEIIYNNWEAVYRIEAINEFKRRIKEMERGEQLEGSEK